MRSCFSLPLRPITLPHYQWRMSSLLPCPLLPWLFLPRLPLSIVEYKYNLYPPPHRPLTLFVHFSWNFLTRKKMATMLCFLLLVFIIQAGMEPGRVPSLFSPSHHLHHSFIVYPFSFCTFLTGPKGHKAISPFAFPLPNIIWVASITAFNPSFKRNISLG